MARTNKVQRSYINRIIEVRRDIEPVLESEVYAIADKLGIGNFRTHERSGLMVAVSGPPAGGTTTQWKKVAEELAARHKIPMSEVMSIARRHSSWRPPGCEHFRVTVKRDTAKCPVKVY